MSRLASRALRWLMVLGAALMLAPAHAQLTLDVPPQVSLLTFGPGDIYWQRFGHNALLLRAADGRAAVFNYGTFDFQQKSFFLNFARGQMRYRLDVDSFERTLRMYAAEGRWIFEQRLALDDEQRRDLAAFLAANLKPENVEYRYDYFADNCSTRVRDALDQVLHGALKAQIEPLPTPVTYREEVVRLMSPDKPLAVGMDLGLGPSADRPINLWQHSFLPLTLMQAVRDVRLTDASGAERALVESEGWIYRPQASEEAEPAGLTGLLPLSLLGAGLAVLLLLSRALRRFGLMRWTYAMLTMAISAVAGVTGLVMLAAWALTEHWGMWANQNLLLFNPLLLALIPVWAGAVRGGWYPAAWAVRVAQLALLVAVAAVAIKSVPGMHQHNLPWIALMLPLQMAMTWTLRAAHRSPPIWSR